ncbi:hypothetical protein R3P38DRAFT_2785790 [Favolaschia claudopus]|uniref:Uncharacterized protein n=1 Tax=Favolaschia claudopus TaxID=2862362 RepID=A0AAW0AUF2_9AGAR
MYGSLSIPITHKKPVIQTIGEMQRGAAEAGPKYNTLGLVKKRVPNPPVCSTFMSPQNIVDGPDSEIGFGTGLLLQFGDSLGEKGSREVNEPDRSVVVGPGGMTVGWWMEGGCSECRGCEEPLER